MNNKTIFTLFAACFVVGALVWFAMGASRRPRVTHGYTSRELTRSHQALDYVRNTIPSLMRNSRFTNVQVGWVRDPSRPICVTGQVQSEMDFQQLKRLIETSAPRVGIDWDVVISANENKNPTR